MGLHNESISVSSRLSPAAVLSRLRQLASQRGRAATAPAARAAGIFGWTLSELPDGICLTPRLFSTENLCPTRFVGSVQPLPSGCSVSGEVRAHWFSRVFTAVLIGGAVLFPLLALIFPGPGVPPRQRVLNAARIGLIAAIIMTVGLLMVRYALRSVAAAVREILSAATTEAS